MPSTCSVPKRWLRPVSHIYAPTRFDSQCMPHPLSQVIKNYLFPLHKKDKIMTTQKCRNLSYSTKELWKKKIKVATPKSEHLLHIKSLLQHWLFFWFILMAQKYYISLSREFNSHNVKIIIHLCNFAILYSNSILSLKYTL